MWPCSAEELAVLGVKMRAVLSPLAVATPRSIAGELGGAHPVVVEE